MQILNLYGAGITARGEIKGMEVGRGGGGIWKIKTRNKHSTASQPQACKVWEKTSMGYVPAHDDDCQK